MLSKTFKISRMVRALASTISAASLAVIAADASAQQEAKSVERVNVNKNAAELSPHDVEQRVFAKYPDLDSEATRAQLKALRADATRNAQLDLALQSLLKEGAPAQRELEKALVPLLSGLSDDDAFQVLAAITRAHYTAHLSTQRALTAPTPPPGEVPAAMLKALDTVAERLATASVGQANSAKPGTPRSPLRARTLRRL